MIETKTLWAVTRQLEIKEKTAIMDGNKLLAVKDVDAENTEYSGNEYGVKVYRKTKEEAEKWLEYIKAETRETVPQVMRFIVRMDLWSELRQALNIKKEDYLGLYADSDRGNRWLYKEQEYAKKLETFIHSRRLDIDGHMIPIDDIKDVQWYGRESAGETEPDEWKAVLTTKDGNTYTTSSENDVRLIWATIGQVSGSWFIDDDINYSSNDSDE